MIADDLVSNWHLDANPNVVPFNFGVIEAWPKGSATPMIFEAL